MKPKRPTWNESLADSALLKEYVLFSLLFVEMTTANIVVTDYHCQRHSLRQEKETPPRLCIRCVRAREGHERYHHHANLLGTNPTCLFRFAVRNVADASSFPNISGLQRNRDPQNQRTTSRGRCRAWPYHQGVEAPSLWWRSRRARIHQGLAALPRWTFQRTIWTGWVWRWIPRRLRWQRRRWWLPWWRFPRWG